MSALRSRLSWIPVAAAASLVLACSSGPDDGSDADAGDAIETDAAEAGAPCTYGDTGGGVCSEGRRGPGGVCRPPETYAPNEETCDGLDNDCDGRRDEGCDADGDGFCREDRRVPDDRPSDVCRNGEGDCWDEAGSELARKTYPGAAVEDGESTCALDRDDDEHGAKNAQIPERVRDRVAAGTDDCDRQPRAWDGSACESCADDDEDGYWGGCQTTLGNPPDCDDGDSTIHPMASEECDGTDSDCDGESDVEDEDADEDCDTTAAECRRDDSGTLCCSRPGERC